MKSIQKKNDHNIDQLKTYMQLPVEKKMEYLEQLNKFLDLATPLKNKKIWKRLKTMGW